MMTMKRIGCTFIILSFLFTLILNLSFVYADNENAPQIKRLTISNFGTYPAADIWLTSGADFENVSDTYRYQLFLVDATNKTETEAIFSGTSCMVSDVPDSRDMRKILEGQQPFGFYIHDLEPGQYYIGAKLSDEDGNEDYEYSSFTVYKCAKDYVKEALDRVIYSYIKEPDGWYWLDGNYVGLGYRTDVYGNSWESWMFPALGTHYTMNDGTALDFSKDGPVLSAYDGRWFKDLANEWPIKGTQSKLWQVGMAELAKHILAFCAYGEDPRNINGLNLVQAGVQTLYNMDGTMPNYSDGSQELIDPILHSYMLLALETAGATPQEGYTRELRDSLFTGMWASDVNLEKDFLVCSPDSYGMTKLALPKFKKYAEYNNDVNKIIVNLNEVIDYMMYANGAITYNRITGNNDRFNLPNADSLAVIINSLVMNGLHIEDFDEGKFTKKYGSLLTSLGSCIVEDGVIYEDEANRMATYQSLGALVDLYCNQSCFEIATKKYKEAYPGYFNKDYGKLSIKSVANIENQTYTGKAIVPSLDIIGELPLITPRQPVYGVELPTERVLEEGLDYTVEYKNNIEPGEATAIITGIGDYYGTTEVKFNIVKDEEEDPVVITRKKQPMTVKPVLRKVSFKKLKKKAQVVKGALIVKNNKGKVSYKKIGGSKKLTINKNTGRITVKKNTKKGTYKIRVKVTAAGNNLYKTGSKAVTVKIKIR